MASLFMLGLVFAVRLQAASMAVGVMWCLSVNLFVVWTQCTSVLSKWLKIRP